MMSSGFLKDLLGFTGDLFVWDIDKTYLVSEFDSFKGLLSIPFEFAIDKRNIAGTRSPT